MKIELEIPNTTAAMTVVTVSENLHENPIPMRLCAKSYNTADIESMKTDPVQTGVWLPENDRPSSFMWVCSICKKSLTICRHPAWGSTRAVPADWNSARTAVSPCETGRLNHEIPLCKPIRIRSPLRRADRQRICVPRPLHRYTARQTGL